MALPSTAYDELVSSTFRNAGTEAWDNVTAHNALYRYMKKHGGIKTFDGGTEITEPILYGETQGMQNYSGYDQLNTNASDNLTSAKYEIRQKAVPVVISGREMMMNSGKSKILDLLDAKKDATVATIANTMNTDMHSDGSVAQQMNGLANFVQTTGQGTVGALDATLAVNAFWRNKFLEATGTNTAASPSVANATQFTADMDSLYISCTRGIDHPDLILMSQDFYRLFEIQVTDKQRYASAGEGVVGMTTLRYKGAEVIFDTATNFASTAEKAYFLCTKFIKTRVMEGRNWIATEPLRPVNQDATIFHYLFMGNMTITNRAQQGVLFDAA